MLDFNLSRGKMTKFVSIAPQRLPGWRFKERRAGPYAPPFLLPGSVTSTVTEREDNSSGTDCTDTDRTVRARQRTRG